MISGHSDLIETASDLPDSVEKAFRSGTAIIFPWENAAEEIFSAIRIVERYLSALPVETSFPGTDQVIADRQSLWVASTGLGQELHADPREIAKFDGDARGGARGLEALRSRPEVAQALSSLKSEIDHSLQLTLTGLRLPEVLPSVCLETITVRYRAIRYAPAQREIAGIGIHPDGNLISALLTDQPGLVVLGGIGRVARPRPEAGVVVMPGSILTRWSDGALLPTVHAVEIRRGAPTKCTVVGFLNFADGNEVPRSSRLTSRRDPFRNEVDKFKNDDMRSDGDLSDFYRDRGFVVTDGDTARFRSLTELAGRA